MIKIEVILHFSFDEDKTDYSGEELVSQIREAFEETVIEENFGNNCKIIKAGLIEEEVKPF